MARTGQEEQYEYKEFGDLDGSGKARHYSDPRKQDGSAGLKKLTKALAAGAAAVVIVTGSIAVFDKDLSGTIKEKAGKKPESINSVSPKDLVHSVHTWNEGEIVIQASCTEKGLLRYSCTGCSETREEPIPPAGHVPVTAEDSVEATCTEGGHTGQTVCQNCGIVLAEATDTEALGHDWSEAVETKAATCTEDGILTSTCSRCGETQTYKIEAAGHVDKNGDYKCDVCKKSTISISITGVKHEAGTDEVEVKFKINGDIKGHYLSIDSKDPETGCEYKDTSDTTFTAWFYMPGYEIAPTTPEPDSSKPTVNYAFDIQIFSAGDGKSFLILEKTVKVSFGYNQFWGFRKPTAKLN